MSGSAPRLHDVDSFDRRARSYEHDWRSQFHTRVVVSTVSFDHWADQPTGLAEIARVLRPGGVAVSG